MKKQHNYTVMHWGTWQVESSEGEIVAVKPVPWDKNPSRIGQSLPDAVTSQTRIRRPAVRAGYLQHGPASREGRGKEPFVEVSWEVALDLLARELRSVKARCGNEAIYGGSYGWASAGRFHHAQSQLHRFLKGFGGYTASTNTYSSAAGERILPHILGPLSPLHRQHTHFSELARECQLFVAIGGLPLRNARVNGGGANDHMLQYWLDKMQANGTRFINISPVRNDLSAVPEAEWLAIRPGTDTALLLALSYVLIAESLYDRAFVASHTVGFAPYRAYLLGEHDGVAKTPAWAAAITGLDAQRIADLAREMARHRTMVNISGLSSAPVKGAGLLGDGGPDRAAGTARHPGRRPRVWLRLHQPGGRGAKSVFRPTLTRRGECGGQRYPGGAAVRYAAAPGRNL